MGAQPVTVLAPYAPVGTGMPAPIPTSQEPREDHVDCPVRPVGGADPRWAVARWLRARETTTHLTAVSESARSDRTPPRLRPYRVRHHVTQVTVATDPAATPFRPFTATLTKRGVNGQWDLPSGGQ